MATLPVIAGIFRCSLLWSIAGGQDAVNVIHVRDVAGGHNAVDIFNVLDTEVEGQMWGGQTDGASVHQVDIIPLDGVTGTQSFPTGSPAKWTGQSGGTTWNPANAELIKLTTGLRGRSHRGRIFLPFVDAAAATDGVMNGAIVTSTTTSWTDFQADLLAAVSPLSIVVASYKLASAANITGISTESVLGTQRRRQGRLR